MGTSYIDKIMEVLVIKKPPIYLYSVIYSTLTEHFSCLSTNFVFNSVMEKKKQSILIVQMYVRSIASAGVICKHTITFYEDLCKIYVCVLSIRSQSIRYLSGLQELVWHS